MMFAEGTVQGFQPLGLKLHSMLTTPALSGASFWNKEGDKSIIDRHFISHVMSIRMERRPTKTVAARWATVPRQSVHLLSLVPDLDILYKMTISVLFIDHA
jgi:hypothetical protein